MILLDLRMPVMDGWTFRREQRGDPGLAGIPIVVLSGMEMDGVQDMDAAASFHKPVSFPEVVDVVRRLCEVADPSDLAANPIAHGVTGFSDSDRDSASPQRQRADRDGGSTRDTPASFHDPSST